MINRARIMSRTWLFIIWSAAFASSTLVTWMGGSGSWRDTSMWSTGQVPDATSNVFINITAKDYVHVDYAVDIAQLSFSGGILELTGNTTFNISGNFAFDRGYVECAQPSFQNLSLTDIYIGGTTNMSSTERKYLRYVSIHQLRDEMLWTGGLLTLTNATIHIYDAANFTVTVQTTTNASSVMIMQADEAHVKYDMYPNKVLNTEVNLIYSNPTRGGVFDIVVANGVRATTHRARLRDLYPLYTGNDVEALEYYAYSVTNSNFGYRYPLYNTTITDTDPDSCALYCSFYYADWCKSFDFSFYNASCRLSKFTASQVGGLVTSYDTVSNVKYRNYHYARRTYDRAIDSYLIADGHATFNCDSQQSSCAYALSVNLRLKSQMKIGSNVNVTFGAAAALEDGSAVLIGQSSTFAMYGINTTLLLSPTANISKAGEDYTDAMLRFANGIHYLNGTIGSGLDLFVEEDACVYCDQVNAYAENEYNANHMHFDDVTVQSSGKLVMKSSSAFIRASNMSIVDEGSFTAGNISLIVSTLRIGANSFVTTNGRGYNKTSGPAPGQSDSLGASGGAHGGRGGPAKVDAVGIPYDSAIYPTEAGSGGGAGYFPDSTGGSGGGIITITANATYLEGAISSDGADGIAGGGGGAGGTIAIYSTYLIGSAGSLSANGGGGGYAGGLMAGGGGSGGRIAVHTHAYDFNGTLQSYGGKLTPTYDLPNMEQAGAGTIYVASSLSSFRAVIVSDQALLGYESELRNRERRSSELITAAASNSIRAAYLYESSLALDTIGSAGCDVDLHLIGAAPLRIAASNFCFNKILGSGQAKLQLDGVVNATYTGDDWDLSHVDMTILNATFATNANITIGANASLTLQSDYRSLYQMNRLQVSAEGYLVLPNTTSISASSAVFQNYSTLYFGNDITFAVPHLHNYGANWLSTSSADYDVTLAASTIMSAAGSLYWKGVQLQVYGKINATADAYVLPHDNLTALQSCQVEIFANSELSVASSVAMKFSVPVQFSASSRAYVDGALYFIDGGSAYSGSHLYTSSNGEIFFEFMPFYLQTGVSIVGSGRLSVLSSGTLYLPEILPASSATVYASAYGSLVAAANSSGSLAMNLSSVVMVEDVSEFVIAANATVYASQLFIHGGQVKLNANNSILHVYDTTSVMSGGAIIGPGQLIIDSSSQLQLKSAGYEDLRFEQVSILNYGTMQVDTCQASFGRHATLENYGLLAMNGSHQWRYNQSILAFTTMSYRFMAVPLDGTGMFVNYTLEDCATECLYNDIALTSTLGAQVLEVDTYECLAFVYNQGLQSCKLFISKFDDVIRSFGNMSNPYSWQVFNKVQKWSTAPTICNRASGKIQVEGDTNSTIGFPVVNEGEITIASSSHFRTAGGFNQTQAGTVEVLGILEVSSGTSYLYSGTQNNIAGVVFGNGTFKLTGDATTYGKSNISLATISDASLTVFIESTVYFYDMSYLLVKNLYIDDGSLYIAQKALTIDAVESLVIKNNGLLSTSLGLVNTDSGCSTCFDLNVTTSYLLVESSGEIQASYAYLHANNFSVAVGGTLSATGRGYATAPTGLEVLAGSYGFLGSKGGGHASFGGYGYPTTAIDFDLFGSYKVHGSIFQATTWGMPGGGRNANDTSPRGGGALIITATSLELNGNILALGESPSQSLAGGGAGGSIRISADELFGSGNITVSGGQGGRIGGFENITVYGVSRSETSDPITGYGGGGGGGRIVIYTNDYSAYTGSSHAKGGKGSQKGSAGTVYIADRSTQTHGTFICANQNDNENPGTALYTLITEEVYFQAIESLIVQDDCRLLLLASDKSVSVGAISGDSTGFVVVGNSTTLIPYVKDTATGSYTNNTLSISDVTLIIANGIISSSYVTIETGATLALTELGGTSMVNQSEYHFLNMTIAGKLLFDYTTLRNHSNAYRPVKLVSDGVNVSGIGVISSDGQGRPGTYNFDSCSVDNPGCGEYGSLGGGGGAYGGYGGAGFSGKGGTGYGSIFTPWELGTGGGGCFPHIAGGAGGGSIYINATTLINEGTISAEGRRGAGAGAGGGSGGSIYMNVMSYAGSGKVSADGGDGIRSDTYFGGGGSGGRIALTCSSCAGSSSYVLNSFILANMTAVGGRDISRTGSPEPYEQIPIWDAYGFTLSRWLAEEPARAAAGTIVYTQGEDITMLINNYVDYSGDHTLVCSNSNYSAATINCTTISFTLSEGVTVLDESNLNLQKLTLNNNAKFRILTNITLNASLIYSDRTSSLEVYGTLKLPRATSLTEGSLYLYGALSGAFDLSLSNGQVMYLAPNASWYQDYALESSAIDAERLYTLQGLTVSRFNASSITLADGAGLVFLGGSDYESYRAVLECETISVDSNGSYISADGYGHPAAGLGFSSYVNASSPHPTHQASGNISFGDGGWHAGRGGGYYYTYTASGNAMSPITYGASGGSTAQTIGATGGGSIRIRAKTSIEIYGTISADGDDCNDDILENRAGAGAGGSIWLEVVDGHLTGNGTMSAKGGNGCGRGGGAGSGGRVAIYNGIDPNLSQFYGQINVGGGIQFATSTIATYVYPPAGGTVYVSDVSQTSSQITGSNNGINNGSAVYVLNGCLFATSSNNYYHVGQVFLGEVDLIMSDCTYEVNDAFLPLQMSPAFAKTLTYGAAYTEIRMENATILDRTQLDLSYVSLRLERSSMLFAENMTLGSESLLTLSTFGSKLVSSSAEVITNLTSSSTGGVYNLSSTYFTENTTYINDGLTYIIAQNLSMYNGSRLIFAPATENVGWEDSNIIYGGSMYLDSNSTISAAEVVSNHDTNWNASEYYSYFGSPSTSEAPASGGGHAGSGLSGSGGSSSGAARGDLIFPVGPGGPGGNDLYQSIYANGFGGGGGGGLRFIFSDIIVLDGLIDVSGGSGADTCSAGGGAGGSIFIDSPKAKVTGTGILRANGGSGSITGAIKHGGGGSGGCIAIRACADYFSGSFEAKGGLSLALPSWFPTDNPTTDDFAHALGAVGNSVYSGGISNFRQIQQVKAAAAGVITRWANQSILSTFDSYASLSLSACQMNGFTWPSDKYQLDYLGLNSWDASTLQTVSSAFIDRIISALGATSNGNLSTIQTEPTSLSLPSLYNNISDLKVRQLELQNAHLIVRGEGDLTVANMSGDAYSLLTIAGRVNLKPAVLDLTWSNFTINMTESSCIKSARHLQISDYGQLQVFNMDIDSASITHPTGIDQFLSSSSNGNCSLEFTGDMTLQGNARLIGSKLDIHAEGVYLYSNSTLSASALGPYGGDGGESPSSGNGLGSGKLGEVGGDGGGFGGHGAAGLTSLYRDINADLVLGSSSDIIYLNDSSSSLSFNSRNGSTYGSYLQPVQMGSGGGGMPAYYGRGGRGGGSIVMYVKRDVHVEDGSEISADGETVFGGGGGGSGGSIWIRNTDGNTVTTAADPSSVYSGNIYGNGNSKITAKGGKICRQSGCQASPDYPGGYGGGGRIRIEKVVDDSLYTGEVSATSGASNDSTNSMLMRSYGSIVRIQAISTLILNQTDTGAAALEIVFTESPTFIVQVITTTGTGKGSRTAANQTDAIVRGTWTLGYRSSFSFSSALSSQATASEVKIALSSLGFSELQKLSVSRRESYEGGWSWSITFHNHPDRIVPIEVDGTMLWTTNNTVNIATSIFLSTNDSYDQEFLNEYTDAPANYSYSELVNTMGISFSDSTILTNHSYGYWRNVRTFRVVPAGTITYSYLQSQIMSMYLSSVMPIPTFAGFVASLSPPYLLDFYDPNWKFPSSQPSSRPSNQPSLQPSRQPSRQPSGQPSCQPSRQPTSQPSMQPSGQPSNQPSTQPSQQPSSKPSMQPSRQPSSRPTMQPSSHPTMQPSQQPTSRPTMQPSGQPSMHPSCQPNSHPSMQPSTQPSSRPTCQPSSHPSMQPSMQPSSRPTMQPSVQPSMHPSRQPSSHPSMQPSRQPTSRPTMQPSIRPSMHPSCQPSSQPTNPTSQPSSQPTNPTNQPTMQPSMHPSSQPSIQPSSRPSGQPSVQPSTQPSSRPSTQPSSRPSMQPSRQPSRQPSSRPSRQPTSRPSMQPTSRPSMQPSGQPSNQPSSTPSVQPSNQPSNHPSSIPSCQPSEQPSNRPSRQPSDVPSMQPSTTPTSQPSSSPSSQPSSRPSRQPSSRPSMQPSRQPSMQPTCSPSRQPSSCPSRQPSSRPSAQPSSSPTMQPTCTPSNQPSGQPSRSPTMQPSCNPSNQPTSHPSRQPSSRPSAQPSCSPTMQPSCSPTRQPSGQPSRSPTNQPTRQPSSRPSRTDSPTP